jgi:hypothetical protein
LKYLGFRVMGCQAALPSPGGISSERQDETAPQLQASHPAPVEKKQWASNGVSPVHDHNIHYELADKTCCLLWRPAIHVSCSNCSSPTSWIAA